MILQLILVIFVLISIWRIACILDSPTILDEYWRWHPKLTPKSRQTFKEFIERCKMQYTIDRQKEEKE